MQTGLAGKIALITGASGGIGRAVAEALAAEGTSVALHAHTNAPALRDWVERQAWKDQATVVSADVRQPGSIEAAMVSAAESFGRVDICVVNAGIWPPQPGPLHELSEQRLREVLETNLLGATWTARAFLKSLAKTGPRADKDGAALVLVGSTAGRFGEAGHVDYAISKAGLYGLLRSLKNEIILLDPYGRVNLVEPGWTVTPMTQAQVEDEAMVAGVARTMALRQLARAKDIARAVAFFSSPELARHVTGEVLTVAGGMEGRTLWDRDAIDVDEMRRRWEEEAN